MNRSPILRPVVLVVDALVLRRAGIVSFLSCWAQENNIVIIPLDCSNALAQSTTPFLSMIVLVIGSQRVADSDPLRWIASLRSKYPDSPLVLISDHDEAAEVAGAFAAGVRGFIPTGIAPGMAPRTLTFVMGGGSFFPAAALVPRLGDSTKVVTSTERVVIGHEGDPSLTLRQQEVLEQLCQGQSNKVIGRELRIRESTVKVHIRQIIRKLGVTNRTQAALSCARLRLSLRAKKHENDELETV